MTLDLRSLDKIENKDEINIYFRFYLEPSLASISTRKTGISKSTIIYDVKVNERRNLPNSSVFDQNSQDLCKINKCFFINIVPNNYELNFLEKESVKSVRTLEYESFIQYLGDKRVIEDELLVVFNKKVNLKSYSFFSMLIKERIGTGQFALAIFINIVTGILLFWPSYRSNEQIIINPLTKQFWSDLPQELYIAFFIVLVLFSYFFWPFFTTSIPQWVQKKGSKR